MKKHLAKILIPLFLAVALTSGVFCLAASMEIEHMWRAAVQVTLLFNIPVSVAVGDVMYCAEYLYKKRGTNPSLHKKLNVASLCLSVSSIFLISYFMFEDICFFTYLPLAWAVAYPVFRLAYAYTKKIRQ